MSHTSHSSHGSSPDKPPEILRETLKRPWLSSAALVVSNLVPLWGVLFQGWDVFVVLFLFWMENVVIGVFNVVRMLAARPAGPFGILRAPFMATFFTVHYGMFTLAHGAMILFVFGGHTFTAVPEDLVEMLGFWKVMYTLLAQRLPIGVLFALAGLVASHTLSFAANFIGKGEYRNVDLDTLMFAPYGRMIALHVALLCGGFAVIGLGAGHAAVAILVVFKIAMDLRAHRKERGRFARLPAAPGRPAQTAP